MIDAAWDRSDVARLFNYGDERGNADLIRFLAQRLLDEEGLRLSRENLMIVGGATWGVNMLTQHLTAPDDVILVDAPSYRDALHIFRDHKLDINSVPIDDGGVDVAAMAETLHTLAKAGKMPNFYYVVPNFQNPTGITLSRERRLAIIELSRRFGFAIIEDDVYRDIRFVKSLPASFYALAKGENVFRLGTFSKTLAPGLRVGWLVAASDWIERFANSGLLQMGGGANPFTAAVVADYCLSGRWEGHVAWLRDQYQRRCQVALSALERAMPDSVSWTHPEGGYFIWLTLPPHMSVDVLEEAANRENVYFASGKGFYVNAADGANQLRLSFSYVALDDMRRGIGTLGELIKRLAKA
jgi:2-aminoadipate transaminase